MKTGMGLDNICCYLKLKWKGIRHKYEMKRSYRHFRLTEDKRINMGHRLIGIHNKLGKGIPDDAKFIGRCFFCISLGLLIPKLSNIHYFQNKLKDKK